jgi:outer membrane protein TolC
MKKSLLLLSLLFSCAYTQTLSLQQSIEKTLLNNPDIQSFILKTELSQKNYDATFADYLPQINLQAEYDFAQTYTSSSNGTFYTKEKNGAYAGASLKQKIWDFQKTSSKIASLKIDENIATLSLEDMKALMVYKIKSLYKLIVVQEEAIQVHKKDLDSKKAYYEQAQALVVQGFKTKADSSRFLSAFYLSQENLAIAQASFDKAKKSLSLYIGERIEDNTTFESDIIKRNSSFQEASVEDKVLANNSQLKIDALNINKNKLLYKSAKASHYGSIDAVASYNHFDTLNEYNTSTIGVTLIVPLYSGGRIEAEAQKARIGIQLAKQEQASKIIAIKENLSNLIIDIARYDKTIASKQAQLLWANDTKDVLQGRYKEGLSTYIEVLDAESLILTAKLGLLEAYYTKSISIDQVDYLKGKIQ